MRILCPLLSVLAFTLLSTNLALAQDRPSTDGPKEKHTYQVRRRLRVAPWTSVNMYVPLERCCPPAPYCYPQV